MGTVLWQKRRLLRSPPGASIIISLATFLFLWAFAGNAAEQKTQDVIKTPAAAAPTATPTPPPPATIPVEEIATQATAVGNLIRGFVTNLAPDNEIETIRNILPQVGTAIALELKSITNILETQPALETLQAQEQIWQQRQSQLTAWLNALTGRATRLQVALNQLNKLYETWARTRDAEQSAKAPPAILQQIDSTLDAIEAAQQPHQAQHDEILNLQSKIAELVASCNAVLAQIDALQQKAVGGIFTRENPPIWDPDLWARAKAMLPERLSKVAASYGRDILLYVRDPSRHMPRHVASSWFYRLCCWRRDGRSARTKRPEIVRRTGPQCSITFSPRRFW